MGMRAIGMTGLLMLSVASGACAHERLARQQLEDEGCTIVSMTKEDGTFVFEARCRGQLCTGETEVKGTRWRHDISTTRTCR